MFTLKDNLGLGSNNSEELPVLKLLLKLAIEKEMGKFQVYGYSKLVIEWVKDTFRIFTTWY
jgi:hypothetical protein